MELQSVKQRFAIIGNSSKLNNALSIAMRVAATNLTVLISGESGVGKEIFSQIIHSLSPRKHNSFIAVNCGAIPEGTIDSELFGHEKGSFTGATEKRKGYFEAVDGGTIFLDEIGETPLGTQARLLRVLESGEYIKVGSSKVQKTDVRIVAASNVDLSKLIEQGKFREDLYYRLNTVPIHVPALRERGEDILLLFRKFASDFAGKYRTDPVRLNEAAQALLMKYAWPGNVRELKNIAGQVSVLTENRMIGAEELAGFLPHSGANRNLPVLAEKWSGEGGFNNEREIMYKLLFDLRKDVTDLKNAMVQIVSDKPHDVMENRTEIPSILNEPTYSQEATGGTYVVDQNNDASKEIIEIEESLSIADKEKELIGKALKKHNGKRKDAALDLGISERTLYRKIKEYEITS